MPYVNIKITREGATPAQKAELIAGVTNLLVRILDKSPATTFVVIDEVAFEDWGIGGLPVDEYRRRQRAAGLSAGGTGQVGGKDRHTPDNGDHRADDEAGPVVAIGGDNSEYAGTGETGGNRDDVGQ